MRLIWDVIAIATGRCIRDDDYSDYIRNKPLMGTVLGTCMIFAIGLPLLLSWAYIFSIFPRADNCPDFVYIYIISRLCYSFGK